MVTRTCSGVVRGGARHGERCNAPATLKITFPDKTIVFMCGDCAGNIAQTAEDLHSNVGMETVQK